MCLNRAVNRIFGVGSSDNIADIRKFLGLHSISSLVNDRRISFMNGLLDTASSALMSTYSLIIVLRSFIFACMCVCVCVCVGFVCTCMFSFGSCAIFLCLFGCISCEINYTVSQKTSAFLLLR